MPHPDVAPVEAPGARSIETRSILPAEISSRASRLRREVDGAYASLRARGPLEVQFHGTDFTPSVMPTLSAGMKFDDAIAVLREAGFAIGARPGRREETDPNRPRDWYGVVSSLELAAPPGARAKIIVTLTPIAPGAYDRVAAVTARLFLSTP